MTQTITERLLPLEAFAGAYKLAGNELFTKCLGAIATGLPAEVTEAQEAAETLQAMNVPFGGEIYFQAKSLNIAYKVAEDMGYNRYTQKSIEYDKKYLWQSLLCGYGVSGFEVPDQSIASASRLVGRDMNAARTAMGPSGLDIGNPLLKSRFDIDQAEKEQLTEAELLRYKLNAREAVKRHGGSGWWNNFMIGTYRRKLEKLS
jgi:hypothetical protein